MRRMIDDYVWHEVDPDGDRRRQTSQIAANYFEKKLLEGKQLVEIIRGRFDAVIFEQWLYHAFYSNIRKGFELYREVIWRAREVRKFGFAQRIQKTAAPFVESLTLDSKFEFDVLRARLLSDTGDPQQSKEILEELIQENKNKPQRLAEIYNALAVSETRLGELNEALQHHLQSLRISEHRESGAMAKILN